MEKDLFLCHSSADKTWVTKLASDLEREHWSGRPLSVFLDAWDVELGEHIVARINQALSTARFVGVVLSPALVNSEWCTAEWGAVIHGDPTNRQQRLVPIRYRDYDPDSGRILEVPPLLMSLSYLDFRQPREYRRSFARLVAKLRGEAPPRGETRARRRAGERQPQGLRGRREGADRLVPAFPSDRTEPDRVPETLLSNLLPMRSFPPVVWSAETSLTTKHDVPAGRPASVIREGRLFTFANLAQDGHPFEAEVRPDTLRRFTSRDWRAEADRWRWYVELLNDTLRSYLAASDIGFDPAHQRYFFAAADMRDGVRRLRWGTGTKRWVVREPDPDKKGYWVHHAARLRFETLDDKLFLSVEPTVTFTIDGRRPVPRDVAGPLTTRWSGKERNGAVLRNVLMWSDALSQGNRDAAIPAGDQAIVIGRLPVTAPMTRGIADDRVTVGALLQFTRAEVDPAAPEVRFAFIEGDDRSDESSRE